MDHSFDKDGQKGADELKDIRQGMRSSIYSTYTKARSQHEIMPPSALTNSSVHFPFLGGAARGERDCAATFT